MLKGKTSIITGCSRGIGYHILTEFVSNGSNIIACSRKQDSQDEFYYKELEKRFNVFIKPIYFDMAKTEEVVIGARKILDLKIPINTLVNNAGITHNSLFFMTPLNKAKEIFEINFFSQFIFIQYISKIMLKQKYGNILNITSTAALDGTKGKSAYGASKAAMISLTYTLAEELAPYIRVNAISPGITNTRMAFESMSPDIVKETVDNTLLKRIGFPSDIARAAVFLCSDMSSYITKQVIRVDGGLK